MIGLDTALGEITLVLFTTLAPAGAMALLLMGLPILSGRASWAEVRRISTYLCLPLIVAMVGLVASATHLGSPANALYVFAAVGSSPLSNEVLCAVVFLMLGGLYWLYSFHRAPSPRLLRLWIGAIDLAALAFIASVGLAYSARTIISWNLWEVPAAIAANALMGGPLVALAGYAAGRCASLTNRRARHLIALAAIALTASVAVYGLQGDDLGNMGNAVASATDLVPAYGAAVAAFALLGAAGIVVAWRTTRNLPTDGTPRGGRGPLPPRGAPLRGGGSQPGGHLRHAVLLLLGPPDRGPGGVGHGCAHQRPPPSLRTRPSCAPGPRHRASGQGGWRGQPRRRWAGSAPPLPAKLRAPPCRAKSPWPGRPKTPLPGP